MKSQEPPDEEIGKALSALVNTATPADRARVLQQYSPLVVTTRAIELLDLNIQRAHQNADTQGVAILEHVRSLIEMVRDEGPDKALKKLAREDLPNKVRQFLESPSWSDRKRMLEANAELLLSDDAQEVLQKIVELNIESPDALNLLNAASSLLKFAREHGIEAGIGWLQHQILANLRQAVSEGSHEFAEELINELHGLAAPDDLRELNGRVIDIVTQGQKPDDGAWLVQLIRKELESAPTPADRAALAAHLGSSLLQFGREDAIEDAIAILKEAIEIVDTNRLRFHGVYGTLGRAYILRTRGSRRDDLLVARDWLRKELETTDQKADTAVTQRLLGEVSLLLDERASAIDHFAASLEVEPDAEDENYSRAGLDLARLRMEQQGAGRQGALEQAIRDLQRALAKAPANSEVWARIQSVLGDIYRERKSGDPAKNSEMGIHHTNQALNCFTRKNFPNEWAQMQHNLGTLYYTDVRGDRSDNIERAIVSYNRALSVHTKQAYPQFYGLTCSALGLAMIERSAGLRETNLEQALGLFTEAATVLDPRESAKWLAECWTGMGFIFGERTAGGERENLIRAAEYVERARKIYHDLGNKEREYLSLSNLAAIYTRLGDFDPDTKLKAIQYAQSALAGAERETDPYYWAMYNRNLGAAIFNQEKTTSANLERALDCLSNALEVFTPDTYLKEYCTSQNYLGHVHFLNRSWEPALEAYRAAIEGGQLSLASAYTEPARRSLVRDTELAHVRSAYCLIQLGRYAEALITLESGKTRLLRQVLTRSEAFPATVPAALVELLQSEQQGVRALEGHMRLAVRSRGLNIADIGQKLHQARSQLEKVANQIRAYLPDFGEPIVSIPEILKQIPVDGALAAFVVTSHGAFVIVVDGRSEAIESNHIVELPSLTTAAVNEIVNTWLSLLDTAKTLDEAPTLRLWRQAQTEFMNRLWHDVAEPIHRKLAELGLKQNSSLLILPQGISWLVPLHAAAREVGGRQRAFADDYVTIVTPSLYVRRLCLSKHTQRSQRQPRLLAVVNPTGDLPFAAEEVSQMTRYFPDPVLLDEVTATRQNVIQQSSAAEYLHFACHGRHNWADPMMSYLKLAGGDRLVLSDIFAELAIGSNRLVVLSACESGLIELGGTTEEFIGLPTGFHLAGATGVISSLWKVDDAATSLLMSRFYESHMLKGVPAEVALCEAQAWLRNLTFGDLVNGDALAHTLIDLYAEQNSSNPNERICDYPFFWAGFIFAGA
jgi:CHAT domain-containing protein